MSFTKPLSPELESALRGLSDELIPKAKIQSIISKALISWLSSHHFIEQTGADEEAQIILDLHLRLSKLIQHLEEY